MYVGHQTLLAKGGRQIAATLRVLLLARRQVRDAFERLRHLGEFGLRVATQRPTVVHVLRVSPVLRDNRRQEAQLVGAIRMVKVRAGQRVEVRHRVVRNLLEVLVGYAGDPGLVAVALQVGRRIPVNTLNRADGSTAGQCVEGVDLDRAKLPDWTSKSLAVRAKPTNRAS